MAVVLDEADSLAICLDAYDYPSLPPPTPAADFQTGEDSFEVWELTLPEKLVEGSDRGWVTAVGDLVALSLEVSGVVSG